MTPSPGQYEIGPGVGSVVITTSRQGFAAKVGHDLRIGFDRWSATVQTGPESLVRARIELASFRVIDGTGGVAPLTDADRREITATALRLLDANAHPEATFVSGIISDGRADGRLTVRGVEAPVSLDITEIDGRWRATGSVLQSAFGIAPYKAFFGALRLADRVGIEIDVRIPEQPGIVPP
jgi:polyisoprenoid-binding protein YceI